MVSSRPAWTTQRDFVSKSQGKPKQIKSIAYIYNFGEARQAIEQDILSSEKAIQAIELEMRHTEVRIETKLPKNTTK